MSRRPSPSSGPLDGVRILDLTAMLAGPFSTMLLADLGADVVKVEPPTGDMTRDAGPFRTQRNEKSLGGYFQSINRGKDSVVLDLKDDQDREVFIGLVKKADVLVENYSHGVMERLGFAYERLAEVNPSLVYGALRGFGDARSGHGPYTEWPAFDVVSQAMGGYLSVTGTKDGVPIKSGPGVGDIFPGALLAIGILAALRESERTGKGQFVDVAMMDSVIALSERMIYQYSLTGVVPGRIGNEHPLLYPFGIFRTADGWLSLAGNRDHHWKIIADAMGEPELALDERFSSNEARARNREELAPRLEGWLSKKSNDEIVTLLGGKVPIGPVLDAAALFDDEQVRARQMIAELEDPGSEKPTHVAGVPVKFSAHPSVPLVRAPLLGESDPAIVAERWTADRAEKDSR